MCHKIVSDQSSRPGNWTHRCNLSLRIWSGSEEYQTNQTIKQEINTCLNMSQIGLHIVFLEVFGINYDMQIHVSAISHNFDQTSYKIA